MDATQDRCTATNMKLNGSKTQVLNVNHSATPLPVTVRCCGERIQLVDELLEAIAYRQYLAKYLGLYVHKENGLGPGFKRLDQRFWMA